MPNLTLQIKNCKTFKLYINDQKTVARGKLHWTDGTLEFEKNFVTFSKTAVDFLDAHRNPESQFEVSGNLTKKEGTKDWAGKWFEEIIISEIKLVGEEKKSEPVVEDSEIDEEIPF